MSIAQAVGAVTPGWSQARIAEVIHADQGTVSKMLRGVGRRFSLEQIEAIEAAAGQPRGTIIALAGHATLEGVRTALKLRAAPVSAPTAVDVEAAVTKLERAVKDAQSRRAQRAQRASGRPT